MFLTTNEEHLLDGEEGEAIQLAMSVLVKIGEMYGADRFIKIENVHIDASTYCGIFDAGLEFCERLVRGGAIFKVPTTLCIAAIDFERHMEFDIPQEVVEKQKRLAKAYLRMGAIPNWTCTPYQCGINIHFGQRIAWGESNAIAFANSVIGARTIRCADFVDVCAAITGLMPRFGLYLDEERLGTVLFKLKEFDTTQFTATEYATLGYYVGGVAGSRVPVLQGVSKNISTNQLKAFSAAVATSGSIGLFHMCEITPEARNLEEALGAQKPEETFAPGKEELNAVRDTLSTQNVMDPEIVVLGCPHYSVEELKEVALLLKNKRVIKDKRLWIFTNRCVKHLVKPMGLIKQIEAAGAKVICDTCFLHMPTSAWELSSIATDSAKMAHYAPGIADFKVSFLDKVRFIEKITK
ncbi:MAG: aconitase X [Candidatus Heimdallarchaeota archaeon]